MTTTKPEPSYAYLEAIALRDLAVRTLASAASPEHKRAARERLRERVTREGDISALIRAAPAGLLHALRAVLAKHRKHDLRSEHALALSDAAPDDASDRT